MLILGIDTTTKWTVVSLTENGQILAHKEAELGRAQSDLLPAFVNEVAEQGKKTFAELDYICVVTGPGYYTGIRTGIAFSAALATALNKKIIPVSTLESFVTGQSDGVYAPLLKARSDLLYSGIYQVESEKITKIAADCCMNISDFLQTLKQYPNLKIIGDDAMNFAEIAACGCEIIALEKPPVGLPALLAEAYTDLATDPINIRGNYLREPDIGPTH